jgi:hypothetical protein
MAPREPSARERSAAAAISSRAPCRPVRGVGVLRPLHPSSAVLYRVG